MTQRETPCFFSNNPELFGVLTNCGSDTAALFVTGFGEEKKSSYKNIVDCCRFFAGKGVSSLRFDLRATGDSDFEFSSLNVEDWVEDVSRALDYLVSETSAKQVVVFALRFGALIAACLQKEAAGICLLAPPKSGTAYLREEIMKKQLRAAITGTEKLSVTEIETQLEQNGIFDLDGIKFPSSLYEGIKKLSWDEPALLSVNNCGVAFFSKKETPAKSDIKAAEALCENAQYINIPSMPFWNQTDHLSVPELNERLFGFFNNCTKGSTSEE